jgi:hypothetical protein
MSAEWDLFATLLPSVVLLCAARLVWVDYRRFEIETPTLSLLAGVLVTDSLLTSPVEETLIRIFSGAAFYGALLLITRTVPRLSRIGAGDPPLIGVTVLMISPWLVTWAVLAGFLILITCAAYSVARGKRFLKSMFPAAPPILGAAIPIYLLFRFPV